MFCPECGNKIIQFTRKCDKCSKEFNEEEMETMLAEFPEGETQEVEVIEKEEVVVTECSPVVEEEIVVDDDLEFYLTRIRELEGRNKVYQLKTQQLQDELDMYFDTFKVCNINSTKVEVQECV